MVRNQLSIILKGQRLITLVLPNSETRVLEGVIITQMADLHSTDGEHFLCDKLTMAVDEINALRPDLVAITGDLSENGFKTEFGVARFEPSKNRDCG